MAGWSLALKPIIVFRSKMQDFKSIFIQKTQGFSIFPRRFGIKEGKTHLYGPPKSGKTSLALHFAKDFKYPIYIDCQDPRNNLESLTQELLKVFLEKKLDLLIIDNYTPGFNLPNIKNIILITPSKTTLIKGDFYTKQILPLSFEEYISVNREQTPLNQLLNTFIKTGNLPELITMPEYQKISRIQEIAKLIFKDDLPILYALLSYQSHTFSTNQLYLQLKKHIKISKDKLYALISDLELQGFLTLINDPKQSSKSLYFYNFALPYALSPSPNFQAIFENMVFLELKSQNPNETILKENNSFILKESRFYALAFPSPNLLEKIATTFPNAIIIAINQIEYKNLKILDFISFALREF